MLWTLFTFKFLTCTEDLFWCGYSASSLIAPTHLRVKPCWPKWKMFFPITTTLHMLIYLAPGLSLFHSRSTSTQHTESTAAHSPAVRNRDGKANGPRSGYYLYHYQQELEQVPKLLWTRSPHSPLTVLLCCCFTNRDWTQGLLNTMRENQVKCPAQSLAHNQGPIASFPLLWILPGSSTG